MERTNQEPRKLIKFGNSSYIIALPKHWVVKHKLKKGDSVYLSETENSDLTVTPKPRSNREEKAPIRINVDKKTFFEIRREVTSAYIGNYNEIIFEGKNLSSKKESINKAVEEKTGIEITEESSDRIIARDIFDFESVSFDRIVRRMDNIIRSMFEEMIIGLKGETFKEWYLKEINKADRGANKVYFLILKIIRRCQEDMTLMRKLKLDNKMLADASWFAFQSEQLGDEIKRVAKLLVQAKLTDVERQRVLDLIITVDKEYKAAMNAYYTKDTVGAQNVANRYDLHINTCNKNFAQSTTPLVGNISERIKGVLISILTLAKIMAY